MSELAGNPTAVTATAAGAAGVAAAGTYDWRSAVITAVTTVVLTLLHIWAAGRNKGG